MSSVKSTSRKALNDLHFSPNKKELVGLSPGKSKKNNIKDKLVIDIYSPSNLKLKDSRKRTSISLPDICSQAINSNGLANSSFNRSEASTPNKLSFKTNTPALKINKKNNISIILEEKENPNLAFANFENSFKDSNNKLVSCEKSLVNNKKEIKDKVECKEVSIQCNKSDEDMLISDVLDNTSYWKLLAHKRFNCLVQTELENTQISNILDEMNAKNEIIRSQNDSLTKLLIEYDEIRKMMLESTQNDEEVEDSGYDISQTN